MCRALSDDVIVGSISRRLGTVDDDTPVRAAAHEFDVRVLTIVS